jgi:hypothetical protein
MRYEFSAFEWAAIKRMVPTRPRGVAAAIRIWLRAYKSTP